MRVSKRDTDVKNSLLDSVGEGEGGMFQENSIETCILSRMKQITGPGWMHETNARTWCSGRTWRERVGRELGGGIGMGKTCEPKAFSFQCMTKFTTNKKKMKIIYQWHGSRHKEENSQIAGNKAFFPLKKNNIIKLK